MSRARTRVKISSTMEFISGRAGIVSDAGIASIFVRKSGHHLSKTAAAAWGERGAGIAALIARARSRVPFSSADRPWKSFSGHLSSVTFMPSRAGFGNHE